MIGWIKYLWVVVVVVVVVVECQCLPLWVGVEKFCFINGFSYQEE